MHMKKITSVIKYDNIANICRCLNFTSSQLSITWSHINDKEVIMSLMGKSIVK